MDLRPWNPWQEIERLQTEMEETLRSALAKIHGHGSGRAVAFVPPTDIVAIGDEYRFYVALPGMLEEDIDITLEGETLIIRGEREPPFDRERASVLRGGLGYGYFERKILLAGPVSTEDIRASYEAGVLLVRVPRVAGAEEKDRT